MGKDGTHHDKLTAKQGFAIGTADSKMDLADHQGTLHQYGEAITAVAASITTAADMSYYRNKYRYFYEEDFLEEAAAFASLGIIPQYWGLSVAETGAAAITNAQGGIMHLTTGGTANATATLTWNNNANFAANLLPVMEMRLRETSGTVATMTLHWGFYKDANDYCYFEYDTAVDSEELYVHARADGGTAVRTVVKGNVGTGATDFNLNANHYYRLEVSNGYWVAYIDEVQVGTGVTIEDDIALSPYFYADNKATAVTRGLFIDYVFLSSGRAT